MTLFTHFYPHLFSSKKDKSLKMSISPIVLNLSIHHKNKLREERERFIFTISSEIVFILDVYLD